MKKSFGVLVAAWLMGCGSSNESEPASATTISAGAEEASPVATSDAPEPASAGDARGRLVAPDATLLYSLDSGGSVGEPFEWNAAEGARLHVSVREPADMDDGQLEVVADGEPLAEGAVLAAFPTSAADATVHVAQRDSGQLLVRYEDPPHSDFEGDVSIHLIEWTAEANGPETRATWSGTPHEFHEGAAPAWAQMSQTAGE